MQLTIQLTVRNKTVRPSSAHPGTVQASRSSRMMIWSDLSILAFVICHISHFTLRVGNDYNGSTCQTSLPGHEGKVHDVYRMMIDGCSHPANALFYIIAMTLLCSHLSHGFASVFQALGLRSTKNRILSCRPQRKPSSCLNPLSCGATRGEGRSSDRQYVPSSE